MYSVKARHVVSQYYVTSNMNLDGIQEFLDKKSTMTEFGPLADISKEEELKVAGQKKTDRSLRRFEGQKFDSNYLSFSVFYDYSSLTSLTYV